MYGNCRYLPDSSDHASDHACECSIYDQTNPLRGKTAWKRTCQKIQIPDVPHYVFCLVGTIGLLYPQIPADICISSAWDSAVYPYADLDPGIAIL